MNDRFKFRVYVNEDIDGGWYFLENGILRKGYLDAQKTEKNSRIWYSIMPDGIELQWGDEEPEEPLVNDLNIAIEQCTGLKDKNGKLIYEGDILQREKRKSHRRINDDYIVQWSDREYGWIVECYNGTIQVHPGLSVHSGFEIIGNIHKA